MLTQILNSCLKYMAVLRSSTEWCTWIY